MRIRKTKHKCIFSQSNPTAGSVAVAVEILTFVQEGWLASMHAMMIRMQGGTCMQGGKHACRMVYDSPNYIVYVL